MPFIFLKSFDNVNYPSYLWNVFIQRDLIINILNFYMHRELIENLLNLQTIFSISFAYINYPSYLWNLYMHIVLIINFQSLKIIYLPKNVHVRYAKYFLILFSHFLQYNNCFISCDSKYCNIDQCW